MPVVAWSFFKIFMKREKIQPKTTFTWYFGGVFRSRLWLQLCFVLVFVLQNLKRDGPTLHPWSYWKNAKFRLWWGRLLNPLPGLFSNRDHSKKWSAGSVIALYGHSPTILLRTAPVFPNSWKPTWDPSWRRLHSVNSVWTVLSPWDKGFRW